MNQILASCCARDVWMIQVVWWQLSHGWVGGGGHLVYGMQQAAQAGWDVSEMLPSISFASRFASRRDRREGVRLSILWHSSL